MSSRSAGGATPDPIVALATAAGRGAVGIVRLSSPADLAPLAEAVCGRTLQPRQAHYGPFLDADGAPIDHGLALWFPAPHSYTGESVLELQAHGGPVVLQLLIDRCLRAAAEPSAGGAPRLAGLRVARPGEFTERAFLNGKLDLAQAEAVADLIDAGTAAAARSAARSLAGEFSVEVRRLACGLEELRVLVEATLDFPEEDIEFVRAAEVEQRLTALARRLDDLLGRARQGALLREGITVVLAGVPNVGKSSLLNALAGEELAIVTPVEGTTRDRIRQTVQIDGVPLHVVDTAGLRATGDEVERIGVERSWQAIAEADVVLWMHDLTRVGDARVAEAEARIADELRRARDPERLDDVLHVFNKCDAVEAAPAIERAAAGLATPAAPGSAALRISARSGEGLGVLREALLARAGWHAHPEGLFTARARHVEALRAAQARLHTAAAQLAAPCPALDLLAEDLRLAHRSLGEITGEFGTEDLLGAIFASFCIGK